jgi:hypothetical protein
MMDKVKCDKCGKDIIGKRGGFSWNPDKFISYFCECGKSHSIKCDKCHSIIKGFEIPGNQIVFNDNDCETRTIIKIYPFEWNRSMKDD